MIEPLRRDDALLADIQSALRQPDDLHIWWLGQSGFLIQHNGRHALLDPYLSDSLTEKYAATNKPHVRMTRRVIAPEKLDFVDVVTSSHNHTDHLDALTLKPILQSNRPRLLIPEANRQFVAERLGIDASIPIGIDAGTTVSISGFEFTAIPSAHESIDRDDKGRCKYLGYVLRTGPWTIYHSGDTILYDDMVQELNNITSVRSGPRTPIAGLKEMARCTDLTGAKRPIDVALLPINGSAPERHVAGNLNGHEAAWLAKQINAGVVVPCHYDMFEFNTASPNEFVAECGRLDQPYKVMRQGERMTIR